MEAYVYIRNISNGFAVCRQPLLPRASSNGDRVCVLDFGAVFMERCVDFAESVL